MHSFEPILARQGKSEEFPTGAKGLTSPDTSQARDCLQIYIFTFTCFGHRLKKGRAKKKRGIRKNVTEKFC